MVTPADVEAKLQSMFIDASGTSLRREDLKKAVEVAALLNELARLGREGTLVDVAAGKSYLGLLAVELLGFENLVVIEREEKRLADVRHAMRKLTRAAKIELHHGDVAEPSFWPRSPAIVTALHACGPASDAVIDAALACEARWLLLVPCCYGATIPSWATAKQRADELGMPGHSEVQKRFLHAFVDGERTLRLEAAGWETTVVPFVAPTVTPHNLLFRARRLKEPRRMAGASMQRHRLLGPHPNPLLKGLKGEGDT
ncbi:MAG: methyltransferase [Archangium sp.]|nr:methyltransferase [Archangium sp.]